MNKTTQWMYYFLIGIISLIALIFLPMIGSEVGLGWAIPNTTVGWLVWTVTKMIVATINILIFHCFMQQAKVNVKDDPKYIEANTILIKLKNKDYLPLSPQKWNKQQYGKKGITLFATSALSTFALTQAILTFDWISMLSYLFTIIMGLIFGILQMKSAEIYWTTEYWEYAKYKEAEDNQAKESQVEDTSTETPALSEEEYVTNINSLLEENK